MKIDDSKTLKICDFQDLECGDIFEFQNTVWIKIKKVTTRRETSRDPNAVDLDTGRVSTFYGEATVYPLDGKLGIRGYRDIS